MISCLDLNNPTKILNEDFVNSLIKSSEESIERAKARKEELVKIFNVDGSSTVLQLDRAIAILEAYKKQHPVINT